MTVCPTCQIVVASKESVVICPQCEKVVKQRERKYSVIYTTAGSEIPKWFRIADAGITVKEFTDSIKQAFLEDSWEVPSKD
jgi:predicted RNA-binding Zn-ribbon protein involved in translation (DUF1610 family)